MDRVKFIFLTVLSTFLIFLPLSVISEDGAPDLAGMQSGLIKIAEEVKPAVVNISAVRAFKSGGVGDFFGIGDVKQQSLGSGFVFKQKGKKAYILTNNHVVAEDAEKITVKMETDKELKVLRILRDPKIDIAVVEVEADEKLPILELGTSSDLKAGQFVMAVGNPLGFDRTVTVGIVSGTGRSLAGLTHYEDFIQTDASINIGNSGGPLVDISGKVVGVGIATINPTKAGGLGFAIPIDMAKDVSEQLIKYGRVKRGWLGVVIQDLSTEEAKAFGLEDNKGALVSDIFEDSPGVKAGIKRKDFIIEVDGEKTKSVREVQNKVSKIQIDKEVDIQVIRKGKEVILRAKVSEMPVKEEEIDSAYREVKRPWLGLKVQELSPKKASMLGIEYSKGVCVIDIDLNSPAGDADIAPGDIIKEINGKEIKTESDYKDALGELNPGENAVLLVKRGDYTIFKVLYIEEKLDE